MSELNLEDPTLAEPAAPAAPPAEPAAPAAPPTEPPKEQVVPLAALIEERTKRQTLEQEIAALRQPPPPPPTPEMQAVTDDEAERYARTYELYTPQGLDLGRAKRIIADQRAEMRKVAKEAAEQAVTPVRAETAKNGKREQFARVARYALENQLIDQGGLRVLAETFASFPDELAANPEVADTILDKLLGYQARSKPRQPAAPDREPTYSEAPGGPRGTPYTMSNLERNVATARGISTADWEKTAKTYQPGQPNVLD